ncbi:MAG: hypothetical protein H6824_03200 [Planctomycetaceae bacterium]|nr:hypothetical protein [Planctomycetaceae bacterium]
MWDRFISFEGQQLFHIGNVCGTCEFFFSRLTDREIPSFEIDRIRSTLQCGIQSIDDTAFAFLDVIPNGEYTITLFTAFPQQAGVNGVPDYFSSEQRLAWADWDPDNRQICSSYFRGHSRPLHDQQMLFEFLIPLYDISLVNRDRVDFYKQQLQSGVRPTAVALSVLDVKSSMTYPEDDKGAEIEPEFRTHWCFANYLLDGHHKMVASHESGKPITLLSFISRDHSWKLVDELIAEYAKDG